MRKLWAATLTLMTSLGMLGYYQEPAQPPAPPAPPAPPEVPGEDKIAFAFVAEDEGDAGAALQEAYDMLRRLRNERLDERSKELVDRATELYKEAVKAVGSDDEGRKQSARGLATAARELARTVERLRDVRLSDRPDPDLPPPPTSTRRDITVHVAPKAEVPLPPIPPALEGGPPVPPVPPLPPGAIRVEALKSLEGLKELRGLRSLEGLKDGVMVFQGAVTGEGEEPKIIIRAVPDPDGEKKGEQGPRRFEFRFDEKAFGEEFRKNFDPEKLQGEIRKQVEEQVKKAREQAEKARKSAREKAEVRVRELQKQAEKLREQAEHRAKDAEKSARHEAETARERAEELRNRLFIARPGAIGGAFSIGGGSTPAAARDALQKAYERIRKGREALEDVKDEKAAKEAKFYLDAARDLYNAARRDAEAGRNDRAAELARAAEALTHVPRNLPGLNRDDENDAAEEKPEAEEREGEAEKEVETRQRVIIRRVPEAVDAKPEGDEGEASRSEDRKQVEVRVEVQDDEHEEDADDDDEVAEAEKEVVGIGIALGVEDGTIRVLQLVPGGPAAKDGRIHPDDVLIGVMKEGDGRVEFEGKELKDVVDLVRGEEGTTVRLIVVPKDSDDEKVIELKRARIEVPRIEREARVEDLRGLFDVIREGVRIAPETSEVPAGDLPPELPE